jgi:hypothetical protein
MTKKIGLHTRAGRTGVGRREQDVRPGERILVLAVDSRNDPLADRERATTPGKTTAAPFSDDGAGDSQIADAFAELLAAPSHHEEDCNPTVPDLFERLPRTASSSLPPAFVAVPSWSRATTVNFIEAPPGATAVQCGHCPLTPGSQSGRPPS